MGSSVDIGELAAAIAEGLAEYSEEVTEKVFDAVDQAAAACNQEIKNHVMPGHGVDTGKYKKAFRIKTTEQTQHKKTKTWYVASPKHRLTHLLENGHALQQGGRSPAVKHIAYGEQKAAEVMQEMCEKAVESNGH